MGNKQIPLEWGSPLWYKPAICPHPRKDGEIIPRLSWPARLAGFLFHRPPQRRQRTIRPQGYPRSRIRCAFVNEAIRAHPKYAMAYCCRSVLWLVKNDEAKAMADLNEAIRVDQPVLPRSMPVAMIVAEKRRI